jgi:hypothetical protein
MKQALKEGRLEEARTYAQATASLKDYMVEDSKRLLDLMGIHGFRLQVKERPKLLI